MEFLYPPPLEKNDCQYSPVINYKSKEGDTIYFWMPFETRALAKFFWRTPKIARAGNARGGSHYVLGEENKKIARNFLIKQSFFRLFIRITIKRIEIPYLIFCCSFFFISALKSNIFHLLLIQIQIVQSMQKLGIPSKITGERKLETITDFFVPNFP